MQLFLLAAMLFAGLVHGTLGLGFPMVATPIIAVLLDVRLAILLTLLPTAAVNCATIFGGNANSNAPKKFVWLIVFSLVGSLFGSLLLVSFDPDPFRLLLAFLILVFLMSGYIGKLPQDWLNQWPITAMVITGLLAGLSAGTTNVMVAVLLIYFLSLDTPRNNMVPTLNACFLAGKVAQIIVFLVSGTVSFATLLHTAPLMIAALLSLWIGQKFQDKVPTKLYRQLLHGLLVLLAAILLVQYFTK